jgi:hypothetical protein
MTMIFPFRDKVVGSHKNKVDKIRNDHAPVPTLVKIIKKNIVIEYQQAQGGKNVLCAEMLQ